MGGSCRVCLHSLAVYWGLELFRRLPCFVTACFKESVRSSCWPNDSERKEFFKWMTCGSHCCRSNWFMMDLEVWGFSRPPAGSLTALILPFEASLRCRRSSFPLVNRTESNKPYPLAPSEHRQRDCSGQRHVRFPRARQAVSHLIRLPLKPLSFLCRHACSCSWHRCEKSHVKKHSYSITKGMKFEDKESTKKWFLYLCSFSSPGCSAGLFYRPCTHHFLHLVAIEPNYNLKVKSFLARENLEILCKSWTLTSSGTKWK